MGGGGGIRKPAERSLLAGKCWHSYSYELVQQQNFGQNKTPGQS